jgi:hypothetical protein
MSGEQPTGESGASVTEQIEALLGGEKPKEQEVEAVEKPEVETPAGDEQDEAEGPQLDLSDVAKVLGVDENLLDIDEDGSVKFKTKIDGKEGAAKLQDFIKSYQLQGHVDEKVRRVAEQEKAHSERVTQIEQFAQTKLQELELTAQFADQLFMQETGQIDWDRLVMEDPVGYTTKRHEYDRQFAKVNQLKQAVTAKRNEIQQAMAWRQQQEFQQEAQRLEKLVPEWSDPKVRNAEGAEMRQWLQSKGAHENTINGLRDAGLVSVLRAAMAAEKKAPQVAAVEKKVRLAPKLVRPGQGTTASDRRDDNARGLMKQIKESGGKRGVAEYLIATGKV